jgi:hypothetical protein
LCPRRLWPKNSGNSARLRFRRRSNAGNHSCRAGQKSGKKYVSGGENAADAPGAFPKGASKVGQGHSHTEKVLAVGCLLA